MTIAHEYRTRPVTFEAVQLTDDEKQQLEILEWAGDGSGLVHNEYPRPGGSIDLHMPLGLIYRAVAGDYIVRGEDGDFFVFKRDEFERLYEEVK